MDVPIEDFTVNKGQRDRIPLSVLDANGNPVPLDPAAIRLETRSGFNLSPIVNLDDPNELVFEVTPEWLNEVGSRSIPYRIRVFTPGDEEMFLTGTITVEGW